MKNIVQVRKYLSTNILVEAMVYLTASGALIPMADQKVLQVLRVFILHLFWKKIAIYRAMIPASELFVYTSLPRTQYYIFAGPNRRSKTET